MTNNSVGTYTVGSNCVSSPSLPGTANMNVNPDFVDITNDNYRLRWTSLCIDHGRSLPGTANGVDIYGNARDLGGGVDIGAVEFGNVVNDFNYDGKSDLTVWDPASAKWYITQVQGAVLALGSNWGFPGCQPESGVGEGGAGMPVFHPASGNWYVRDLAGEIIANGVNWGYPGCTAVMEDYNGGGTDDAAVYDLNSGNWYIKTLDNMTLVNGTNWGYKGCYRSRATMTATGTRTSRCTTRTTATGSSAPSTAASWPSRNWGFKGCVPVPGDFDGDGSRPRVVPQRVGQLVHRAAGRSGDRLRAELGFRRLHTDLGRLRWRRVQRPGGLPQQLGQLVHPEDQWREHRGAAELGLERRGAGDAVGADEFKKLSQPLEESAHPLQRFAQRCGQVERLPHRGVVCFLGSPWPRLPAEALAKAGATGHKFSPPAGRAGREAGGSSTPGAGYSQARRQGAGLPRVLAVQELVRPQAEIREHGFVCLVLAGDGFRSRSELALKFFQVQLQLRLVALLL